MACSSETAPTFSQLSRKFDEFDRAVQPKAIRPVAGTLAQRLCLENVREFPPFPSFSGILLSATIA